MPAEPRVLLYLLDHAYRILKDNVRGLTLDEALFVPQGGYRSILGTLKRACGGHNNSHLKQDFQVTGVDLSAGMLEHARRLNPEATYIRGDLRTVRLGTFFDAVIIADAIDYMLTEADLAAAFATAALTCGQAASSAPTPSTPASISCKTTANAGPGARGTQSAPFSKTPTTPTPAIQLSRPLPAGEREVLKATRRAAFEILTDDRDHDIPIAA